MCLQKILFYKYSIIQCTVFLLIFCMGFYSPVHAQGGNGIQYNDTRFKTVVITESVITTLGMMGLYYLWYKKFPKSRFHLFNDNAEWFSMDKMGHATTAYNMSAIQYDMMRWSGVKQNNAAWIGGLTAFGLQTFVEILDGYNKKWGFSKGDMLANILGSALFVGQQYAWGEQRMRLKFSFHKTIFARYNPSELGANKWQRWLKDYNGQTYWLSINPASFLNNSTSFPAWLNFSAGYGADGMIGARTNPVSIGDTVIPVFSRSKRFLFSADVDLKRIDTKSNMPKTLLSIPSILKVPAPAIEYRKKMPLKFSWLYF
jgi:hypothetical protein